MRVGVGSPTTVDSTAHIVPGRWLHLQHHAHSTLHLQLSSVTEFRGGVNTNYSTIPLLKAGGPLHVVRGRKRTVEGNTPRWPLHQFNTNKSSLRAADSDFRKQPFAAKRTQQRVAICVCFRLFPRTAHSALIQPVASPKS